MAFETIILWIAVSVRNTQSLNEATHDDRVHALSSPIASIKRTGKSVIFTEGALGFYAPSARAGRGIAPLAIVAGVLRSTVDEITLDDTLPCVLMAAPAQPVARVRCPRETVVQA